VTEAPRGGDPGDLPDPLVIGDILQTLAGGYLRNSLAVPGVTCTTCRGPTDDAQQCGPCRSEAQRHGASLADRVGVLTYAPDDGQAARAMYGYKQAHPLQEHRALAILMCHVGLRAHMDCLLRLTGRPVTHWASVPSQRGRQGEHPLHVILRNIARDGTEIRLAVGRTPEDPRLVNPDAFVTLDDPTDAHVLLVDDTWARGGHSQSAAVALKADGAAEVSILVLARWLKMGWPDHRQFVRDHLTTDFSLEVCPWTGDVCPAP
jgi:predicted amidophosphoribosyltransferase